MAADLGTERPGIGIRLRRDHDRQHAAGKARSTFGRTAAAAPGQTAGEQIDHEPERAAFMTAGGTAERHQIARRIGVQLVGIGGRPALGVEQTVGRDRHALVARHPDLALGGRRGGEIQHDGIAAGYGNTHGDRIGGAPAGATALGHDPQGNADRVDEVQRGEARGSRHLGPVAKAPEMGRVAQRRQRDAVPHGLVDRRLHRLLADDLPIPELSVEHGDGIGLADHLGFLVGHDRAVLHLPDVLRHPDHAVRVVPGQVGIDQTRRDLSGFFSRRARRCEDGCRELPQPVCRNLHLPPPCIAPPVSAGARPLYRLERGRESAAEGGAARSVGIDLEHRGENLRGF